jgi:hypothetical protein
MTPIRILLIASAAALLSGCPEDPMGPDNRMAMIALGQCKHELALDLVDQAIATGNDDVRERGLMLKAAILRDRGDTEAAEDLYPQIAEAWKTRKGSALKESRRERDIGLYLDVARAERQARGLSETCEKTTEPEGSR